jgi:hypothetical protein
MRAVYRGALRRAGGTDPSDGKYSSVLLVQARAVGGVRSSSVGSESCRLLSSGGISGIPGLGGGGGTGIRASAGGGG